MSFRSDRVFQIWDYNVSHKQLLVRSPAAPGIADNVDMIFWGVEYLGIPSTLHGVELGGSAAGDVAAIRQVLGKDCDPGDIHTLTSGGHRFVVVAAGYRVLRNNLDIFESSLEYFAATDPNRNLGEVLVHS